MFLSIWSGIVLCVFRFVLRGCLVLKLFEDSLEGDEVERGIFFFR